MKKITIFSQCFALSQKWDKIGPWLLWNVNREPYVSFQMVKFPMILSDFYPDIKVMILFNVKSATLTVTDLEEVVYYLSNGAIFSDFEWPLTQILRWVLIMNIFVMLWVMLSSCPIYILQQRENTL